MRCAWALAVIAGITGPAQWKGVDAASGKASFRDFRSMDPDDTTCKPDVDFRGAGVDAFVAAIAGLSGDARLQCGTCLRVMNPATGISTVVRLVDTGRHPKAVLELSVDAFASIAALDGRIVDVKYKIVPCEEQGVPPPVAKKRHAGDSNRTRSADPEGENNEAHDPHAGLREQPKKHSGMPKHRKNHQRRNRKAAYRKTHRDESPHHKKPGHPQPHEEADADA